MSESLKREAESKMMRYMYIRRYDMQCHRLRILENVCTDAFNWQCIMCGYSTRLLKFIIYLSTTTLSCPDNRGQLIVKNPIYVGFASKKTSYYTIFPIVAAGFVRKIKGKR